MMLRKRTVNAALLLVVAIGAVGFGLTRSAPVASQDDADLAAKIENAMSAAPSAISANATILDNALDDAGAFVVLREGSNDWSCFPISPPHRGMIRSAWTKRGWRGCMRSSPATSRR
jgi:hypothetical protein